MNSHPPGWVADAVFYQIFPDRFARSGRVPKTTGLEPWETPPTVHGYKGGDLYGVVEKLDWLQQLGVTALYLNPIFQATANHRYHTHDYHRVDPLLGGDEAFDHLLQACHDRGLRVVLDGVFNHASRGFLQFNDLLENGEDSPWRDWFIVHRWPVRAYGRQAGRDYQAWWGLPALPKLNTDNPEVREFLMGVGEYWLHRGIDGWRLDVPTEIKTAGFWEEFRQRVRAINAEAWIVAEIWDDAASWVNDGTRFDGTMNYLLTEAILRFVIGSRIRPEIVAPCGYNVSEPLDAGGFRAAIETMEERYTPAAQGAHLNLLGSHDTPRILTVANGCMGTALLAWLLLFVFPGAPSIYYGDEIGMRGRHDPGCRAGFPWRSPGRWNGEILAALRSLIRLRRRLPALRAVGTEFLPVGSPQTQVFVRGVEQDAPVLVAVNASEVEIVETLPTLWGERLRGDLAWGAGTLNGHELRLPPRAGGVWE